MTDFAFDDAAEQSPAVRRIDGEEAVNLRGERAHATTRERKNVRALHSSHSLSAERGRRLLPEPPPNCHTAGIHERAPARGRRRDLSVGCQVLNNGVAHAVEAGRAARRRTTAAAAFFYGQALACPCACGTRAATACSCSRCATAPAPSSRRRRCRSSTAGASSAGCAAGAPRRRRGRRGRAEAAHASAEAGGRLGAPRGIARRRRGRGRCKRYALHDHLFRAEVFREGFGGEHGSILDEREDWLDDLALKRIGEQRATLNDREKWLRAPHCHDDERAMADRAFLCVELPKFDHPVLWEERPYGPPPVAPDVDAALARSLRTPRMPATMLQTQRRAEAGWTRDEQRRDRLRLRR